MPAACCGCPTSTRWWRSTSPARASPSACEIEGAQFLNDLATAPDGTVYVSDSTTLRVYQVRDGKSSVFVEGADVVEQPNGLLVDGGRLDSWAR